jgi:hypothetical protein
MKRPVKLSAQSAHYEPFPREPVTAELVYEAAALQRRVIAALIDNRQNFSIILQAEAAEPPERRNITMRAKAR